MTFIYKTTYIDKKKKKKKHKINIVHIQKEKKRGCVYMCLSLLNIYIYLFNTEVEFL